MASLIKKVFKKKWLLLILTILIIIVWRYSASRNTADVKTARIERGKVTEELVLSGEVRAEEDAKMNFLTSGELNYIGVKEGQEVKKGDILVKLNSTNAYQTFLQAEADLRRYDAVLDRTYDDLQGHSKDESYTQIETRTTAETNRDKAYRTYVIAQKNLTDLTLKAPFDGVVTNITHPYTGINTSLTESQIEIINPKSLYFSVSADQTEVFKLKPGQKVKVTFDSFPEKDFAGEIAYVGYSPQVGETGAIYEVKVLFNSDISEENIKIAMTGDSKVILSEKDGVLYVPTDFIHSDAGGKYINLAKKNNKKYVEIGVEGDERTEIQSSDVNEGDVIFD